MDDLRLVPHGEPLPPGLSPAKDYLSWVQDIADAPRAAQSIHELPWWAETAHDDQIAYAHRHPGATAFDGQPLAEDRLELEFGEFVERLVTVSGILLEDLASRAKHSALTKQRIELATLAIGRFGLRVRDVAALTRKHLKSVTKWLNRGLCLERDDPDFKARLDTLDGAISRRTYAAFFATMNTALPRPGCQR